jgi:hypothetical protein
MVHAISRTKFFSQKYGNAGNRVYVYENTWHVLVNFIIKWGYIYRSAHAFNDQLNPNGDTVAEMFCVRWHRFRVCWCHWDSLPSRLSSTNNRQPQGLLWQLRVCMSHLCCALCYIFILNGTIKQWNCFKICDSSLASYQWLLYIRPHLILTGPHVYHGLSNVFIAFPALPYFWPKNSCHNYGLTLIQNPYFHCRINSCYTDSLWGGQSVYGSYFYINKAWA